MNEMSLKTLYSNTQNLMTSTLLAGRTSFAHAPTQGSTNENNWINWMRQYLPKRYCVDNAFIIDSENHLSDQMDLVIYDQQYSHLVFEMNGNKYITAESVYAVFEIKTINIDNPPHALPVGTVQIFLDEYLKGNTEAVIDYIHGEDEVLEIAKKANSCGFLYDGMGKSELFTAVEKEGVLPRKTFSMGHARDKRYYTEVRKIK